MAPVRGSGIATVPPTSVCATPDSGQPPGLDHRPDSGPRKGAPLIIVGSAGIYQDDGTGAQPILETPPMSADDAGCVHVG